MTGIEPFLFGLAASGGAAATSGIIGTAGAFSLGTALSTGLTMASAASALFGGAGQAGAFKAQAKQEAYALNMNAREELLGSERETLRGKEETNSAMETLFKTIASQQLAYSSGGLDIGFGTPVNVMESTRKTANLQLGVTRDDARLRSLSRRRQASAMREQSINVQRSGAQNASSAIMSGIGGAAGSIGSLIDRRTSRG